MGARDYQERDIGRIFDAWDKGHRVVMYVLPTGGGKTYTFASIVELRNEPTIVIAHRQELVKQMSLTLAGMGIYHRLIASTQSIKLIVAAHMRKFGKSFYNPNALVAASSVQTIDSWMGTGVDGEQYARDAGGGVFHLYEPRVAGRWGAYHVTTEKPMGVKIGKSVPKSMRDDLRRYLATVKFWVGDEGHHYLKDNVWGRAVAALPTTVQGLLVTATPERADGKGLGSWNHGLADTLVVGPPMRELIKRGFLTDYRVIAPPSNVNFEGVKRSKATGELNVEELGERVEQSSLVHHDGHIVGDVVESYLKYASGKLGLTFVPTLKVGREIVKQYNESGVTAELIHGAMDSSERDRTLQRFERREVMQLVNVDVLGEGTDIPAVEVISMVRLTASYGLYVQQFGRVLRLMDGKDYALVIDHVGNVMRHGLPDGKRGWTLEPRDARGSTGPSDAEPVRTCTGKDELTGIPCMGQFARYLTTCPYCKTDVPKPSPSDRKDPEFVDGDLHELDAETLSKLRGDADWVDNPTSLEDAVNEYRMRLRASYCAPMHEATHAKRFTAKYRERLEQRDELHSYVLMLRDSMAWWAGHLRSDGLTDSEIFRKFYLTFGVDWLSAQAQNLDDTIQLYQDVTMRIGK